GYRNDTGNRTIDVCRSACSRASAASIGSSKPQTVGTPGRVDRRHGQQASADDGVPVDWCPNLGST
ncbi:MAG: hypothetical protein WBY88_08995, partial [Desulfosarcina sp.]